MIFEDIFTEKRYRYPAFNGRYAFGFNQAVDDRPYKSNQNYDIGMRVITLHENDVTAYDNQAYTYTDGTFTADPDQAAPKTNWQKVQMLFSSLLYLAKTTLGKVVHL